MTKHLPDGSHEELTAGQQIERYGFAWQDCERRNHPPSPESPWIAHYQRWGFLRPDWRRLQLESLQQSNAYAGQLCGLPNLMRERRQDMEEAARQRHPWFKGAICFLPPVLHAGQVLRQGRDGAEAVSPWLGLPAISCMGELSIRPALTDEFSSYSLLVVWWQDEFGQPDARAVEQLGELSLERYAYGWDW